MKIKWYPWLSIHYQNIIFKYNKKIFNPVLLMETPKKIGSFELIWALSTWMLCTSKIGMKFCKKCLGCCLMFSKSHPDWYFLDSDNKQIDAVSTRSIIQKIFNTPQQGGLKIIYLKNPFKFSSFISDSLLKILEEPPNNTFFFITNNEPLKQYKDTLYSRCVKYKITQPDKKNSLIWLKKNTLFEKKKCLIALKISNYSPILAKNILNSNLWQERHDLFKTFYKLIKTNLFLNLLPLINTKNYLLKIEWINCIFLDSLKYYYKLYKNIQNIDQIKLIKKLYKNFSKKSLNEKIQSLLRCKKKLLKKTNINSELIILQELIKWKINN
ncbi:DNA polymerase III subunit delta' C-terminal domain-containing protein [Buchnera aphidicola (Kurisakia onigurumii)]|uniref:DNA polymerase III subunit delta' C-terminal domain-containing protein n=1 Tax=Buchnera aphidicola TaxID=9 RepID=UPI0031B68662